MKTLTVQFALSCGACPHILARLLINVVYS